MKVADLKKQFPDQWVVARVTKEGKYHKIIEVEPIAHSKDRDEAYDALPLIKPGEHFMTTYTGEPPKDLIYMF